MVTDPLGNPTTYTIARDAGSTKPKKGSGEKPKWDGTNTDSRKRLRDKVAEFHDRMFNNSAHIGHNKFGVLVDRRSKQPKAVLAGSTNWTFTGLCTQSNNVIVLEDEGAVVIAELTVAVVGCMLAAARP